MRGQLMAGTAVVVRNPYGESTYVLAETITDNPEAYRTVRVSLAWDGSNAFRTEGRVRRVTL